MLRSFFMKLDTLCVLVFNLKTYVMGGYSGNFGEDAKTKGPGLDKRCGKESLPQLSQGINLADTLILDL